MDEAAAEQHRLGGGYETRADYGTKDAMPGALDRLRDHTDRLHHQIGLLQDLLGPVLGPESPLAGVPQAETPSALDEQVRLVGEAVDRIMRLRDRLVL